MQNNRKGEINYCLNKKKNKRINLDQLKDYQIGNNFSFFADAFDEREIQRVTMYFLWLEIQLHNI